MAKTFFTVLFLFLIATSSHAAPSIRIDKPQHDFGTITQADKAEHVFEIENRGDSDLVIEKLAPS
jgi:P pilus assembly chaperone PapD